MQHLPHETISFAGFTLDLARGCLLRGTEEIKLRPKSFEVLRHLVENNGRLVSKNELLATVWPDTAVTDDSLVQCLIEVRRALGDTGQRIIKTVPRRGYIFETEVTRQDFAARQVTYTEDVEAISVTIEEESQTESAPLPARAVDRRERKGRSWGLTLAGAGVAVALVAAAVILYRQRADPIEPVSAPVRSVAVLPLKNLTGDPANEYFVDGMTESLINALSRIEGLKVISRGSVFSFKVERVHVVLKRGAATECRPYKFGDPAQLPMPDLFIVFE